MGGWCILLRFTGLSMVLMGGSGLADLAEPGFLHIADDHGNNQAGQQ